MEEEDQLALLEIYVDSLEETVNKFKQGKVKKIIEMDEVGISMII